MDDSVKVATSQGKEFFWAKEIDISETDIFKKKKSRKIEII